MAALHQREQSHGGYDLDVVTQTQIEFLQMFVCDPKERETCAPFIATTVGVPLGAKRRSRRVVQNYILTLRLMVKEMRDSPYVPIQRLVLTELFRLLPSPARIGRTMQMRKLCRSLRVEKESSETPIFQEIKLF